MLVSSVPLSETRMAGRPCATDDDIELTRHPKPRQRHVGHQRQAFPAEVVDHQDPKAPAVGEYVRHEFEAPAPIGVLPGRDRSPRSRSPFAAICSGAPAATLPVEAAELLVVYGEALAGDEGVQTPVA